MVRFIINNITLGGGNMTKKKEKSTKVVNNKSRRKVLKTLGSAALLAGASNFLPMPWIRKADAANHILIGIPSSLSIFSDISPFIFLYNSLL